MDRPQRAAVLAAAARREATAADLGDARGGRGQDCLPRDGAARHDRADDGRASSSSSSSRAFQRRRRHGCFERTEELLQDLSDRSRSPLIMADIKGASGRAMWQRLSHIEPEILANFLRNEYPQTVAVILSRLRPDHAAQRALDPARRLRGRRREPHAPHGDVQKEALDTSRRPCGRVRHHDLADHRGATRTRLMAEVFNAFDRQTEGRFLPPSTRPTATRQRRSAS